MESFTEADRNRAIRTMGLTESVNARLDSLERGQRQILRRQRRVAPAVAKAISQTITRRAAVLLGVGVMIGSALGGAAIELVRRLFALALTGH